LNAARNHSNFNFTLRIIASLLDSLTVLIVESSIFALVIYALNVLSHEVVSDTIGFPVGVHLSIILSQELGLELLWIEDIKNHICLSQALLCDCWSRQCRKQLQSLDLGPTRNARLEQKREAVVTAPSVVAAKMGS
jgi:hypothetical protein